MAFSNFDHDPKFSQTRELITNEPRSSNTGPKALNRSIPEKESTINNDPEQMKKRIQDLETQLEDYEALLAELPDLFERKFQQRLEPLLERYRLLAEANHNRANNNPLFLVNRKERSALPTFFRNWQKSMRRNHQNDNQAA